jgi:hypothetical protein
MLSFNLVLYFYFKTTEMCWGRCPGFYWVQVKTLCEPMSFSLGELNFIFMLYTECLCKDQEMPRRMKCSCLHIMRFFEAVRNIALHRGAIMLVFVIWCPNLEARSTDVAVKSYLRNSLDRARCLPLSANEKPPPGPLALSLFVHFHFLNYVVS